MVRVNLSREVTEIEDQIAKDFVRLICQQLQTRMAELSTFRCRRERDNSQAQLQKIFSAKDNGLVFSFSVNMQSAGGGFQLMLPLASLGAFLGANTASARELSQKRHDEPQACRQGAGLDFRA